MAFAKAIQKVNEEEYTLYLAALMVYKKSCSDLKKVSAFKRSSVASERLAYFDVLEKHRLVCKAFHQARDRWSTVLIHSRLKSHIKGIESISDKELFGELLNQKIPVSLKDVFEAERNRKMAENISEEEIDAVRKAVEAARKKEQTSTSMKEQFTNRSNDAEDDPTLGDFDPL